MPDMLDIGPFTVASAPAVSSLSYAPPQDREFRSHRILVVNPTANDTWVVSVGGKELMRFYELTTGNQQLLGGIYGQFPRSRDIWTWFNWMFGYPLTIPVPRGQALTVASLGGATANVTIQGRDLVPGSINIAEVNHYMGNHFIIPYFGYVNAAVTATGEAAVDTEVKPAWIKNLMLGNPFATGWRAQVLAHFFEAASVNTFSGAANHVSSTDHVAVLKNGERLYSHVQSGQTSGPFATTITVPAGNIVAPNGVPNFSVAAAAGSANTVYNQGTAPAPAFQVLAEEPQVLLENPLQVNPGDELQYLLGITGDVTGGASYAGAVIALLVDVLNTGG